MDYDYNTSRERMFLPEYGRNIQKMVNHILSIEDRDERNRAAYSIISVMGNLNPHLRDQPDFKHKLWDHLALISDFNLDIDAPYPIPEKSKFTTKPRKVPYDNSRIRFKHYGNALEEMVKKASLMPEGPEKVAFIEILANLMKKMYLTYNREAVSDEVIFSDMREISGGKVSLNPEGLKLSETRDILQRSNKGKMQNQNLHQKRMQHSKRNFKKK